MINTFSRSSFQGSILVLFAMIGFLASTIVESFAQGTKIGIISGSEAMTIYGTQCTALGGTNCSQSQNLCKSTGCNGRSSCGFIKSLGNCYQLQPNSQPAYNCSVLLAGGNCCATTNGSGCFTYLSGPPNGVDRFNPCSSQCNLSATCGTPIYTIATCGSSGGGGSGGGGSGGGGATP